MKQPTQQSDVVSFTFMSLKISKCHYEKLLHLHERMLLKTLTFLFPNLFRLTILKDKE